MSVKSEGEAESNNVGNIVRINGGALLDTVKLKTGRKEELEVRTSTELGENSARKSGEQQLTRGCTGGDCN